VAIAAVVAVAFVQTASAAHAVYSSGTIKLGQSCGGDLDDNITPCDYHTASAYDVYFTIHSSTNRVITYSNAGFSSKILKMGAAQPGYLACKNAALGFYEYRVSKNVGNWFCFLTNDGRYSRVHIDSVLPHGAMTVSFTTWV